MKIFKIFKIPVAPVATLRFLQCHLYRSSVTITCFIIPVWLTTYQRERVVNENFKYKSSKPKKAFCHTSRYKQIRTSLYRERARLYNFAIMERQLHKAKITHRQISKCVSPLLIYIPQYTLLKSVPIFFLRAITLYNVIFQKISYTELDETNSTLRLNKRANNVQSKLLL